MRLQCAAAVIAITVLGSGAAAADPALTHEVSAGVLGRNVAWFAGSAWRHEVEVATRATLSGPHALPLTAVGGLRLAVFSEVRVPIEGFVRVELTGRFGRVMEPTCGLELAFGRLDQPDLRRPAGAADLQSERTGLFSASIVATPLRLRVGRFHIIVADFQLGTSIGGSVSRFGIGYAKVDQDFLVSNVSSLVEAHRGDAPLDCARLEGPDEVLCEVTHLAARRWLVNAFQSLGYEPVVETGPDGSLDIANVIAELPGRTREMVVVGAHYDAVFAAADDNATGVAAVVELARIFRGRQLQRTIRFMGFDLEELGMVGSSAYARGADAEAPIAAVFNVDGVGYTATSQPYVPGFALPSSGDFLAVIANEPSVEVAAATSQLARVLDLGRVEGIVAAGDGTGALLGLVGVGSGDHAPFWVKGIPAVVLTDTGPVRDDAYHSPRDTPERIDRAFLAANARVVGAAVAYVAGAPP